MSNIAGTITIRLRGQDTEDGRTYVTSPDLRGFHFVLEPNEDPLEAMEPTLRVFVERYLETEITELTPAMTPRDYRARQFEIPRHDLAFPRTLIAALA